MTKCKPTYIIALLAALVLLIMLVCGIFCNKVLTEENVEEKHHFTYLSPYTTISPYDSYFRRAGEILGYDWTLVAAIAFTESRFDSTAVSGAGAIGVMQMMPRTMSNMGIPDSLYTDTQTNIIAATELIRTLDKYFKHISDKEERLNFVLASYNAGYGHVSDAVRLAGKYGKNRYRWYGNVDSFLIYKNEPEYYTDTLCLHGQFKGWRETLSFVNKVRRNWRRFSRMQQQYSDSINAVTAADSTKRIQNH